ncbi:unnamed protein product [Calypogeia fissa]
MAHLAMTILIFTLLSGGLTRSSSGPLPGVKGTAIPDEVSGILVSEDSHEEMGLSHQLQSLITDGSSDLSSRISHVSDMFEASGQQTSEPILEEFSSLVTDGSHMFQASRQQQRDPRLKDLSSLITDGSHMFQASMQQKSGPQLDDLSSDLRPQTRHEPPQTYAESEGLGFGSSSSRSSMILLLNGDLYTPSPIGRAHILLAGKSVVAIFRDEEFSWSSLVGLPVQIIDVNGSLVAPGLIDIHVHITGGGGEAGPASRTPEAGLSELLDAGLTTVVGTLGTDCVSRSLENLRTKAAALKEEGLTAYMWSGCYRVPSPTLTGSLVRDLQLIEEVVGAGEIAISDHRGSWPTTCELVKIVSDARVGGMLSGKAGIVHFHTGAASSLLDPLWDVINFSKGAIPITQMIPTHISSRGQALLEAAETWIQAGGYVDITADQESESAAFTALRDWHQKGAVALDHISLSSDGFGSLPSYNAQGELLKYDIASPKANLYTIQQLVLNGGWTFQQAASLSTVNPATFLSLAKKGKLDVGMDADVIVLNALSLQLEYVVAAGQLMKTPTWTKTGLFGK